MKISVKSTRLNILRLHDRFIAVISFLRAHTFGIRLLLFLSIFFSALQSLSAQVNENVTLAGPVTGEVKARESITLAHGFETTNADFVIVADIYVPPILAPTGGGDINYIYSRTLRKEINDTSEISTLILRDIAQQVQYFDGLGRQIQSVDIAASPLKNDIVVPIFYDEFGRESEKYLPYVVASNGQYQSEAITNQKAWYSSATETLPSDSRPFTYITFENSPLNRVLSQQGPGQAWNAAGKAISFKYETNGADEVIFWGVEGSNSKYKNYYKAGELYKNITADENGNTTTEYIDKQGKVILKTGEEGTKTYYVYDDFGLLRFVIPPKAVEINGAADLKSDVLKNLCYYYEYDARKRMILKKLPGVGAVTMEYDQRDRLIATVDSMQRSGGEISFITYDELNRPIRNGIRYADGKADTLVYTFYDDYSFISDLKLNISYTDESGYTTNVTDKVKARVTGIRTKLLGSDKYLTTANYYDKYGRVVQVQTINQFGQTDRVTKQYHFWGGLEKTIMRHRFDASDELVIEQKFKYDHAGRLLSTIETVNGGTPVTISEMAYNELGQISAKKLHVTGSKPLQKVDYEYNIRGWLTGLNPTFNADENDLFALILYYTDTTGTGALLGTPQYNGNISAMKWRGKTEVESGYAYQAYGFNYDKLNRLTSSKHGICSATGVFPAEYMDRYNEGSLKYDSNGNILNLSRTGGYKDVDQIRYGQMDSLRYKYIPNSNQLMSISDNASIDGYGFNDINKDTTDFAYDGNGNLTHYKDKKIQKFEYNFLNLPKKIVFDNTDSIVYLYDATGIKHVKRFFERGKQKNAEYYVGGIIYETDSTEVTAEKLKFVLNTEGKLTRLKNGKFRNDYFLKDHLGNTRAVFADTLGNGLPTVIQETNYYPFGLAFTGVDLKTDKNKFLYNGKELQVDGDLGMYDYGARFYDPQIGRWQSVDNFSESSYSNSPYIYCKNNPVIFLDPDGNTGVLFLFFEARAGVSAGPESPGVTFSGGLGLMIDFDSGQLAFYGTGSGGAAYGLYYGAGIGGGYYPNAEIQDLIGWGMNAGVSGNFEGIFNFGVEGNISFNLDAENLNDFWEDLKFGGNLTPGTFSKGFGGLAYAEASKTTLLGEIFTFNNKTEISEFSKYFEKTIGIKYSNTEIIKILTNLNNLYKRYNNKSSKKIDKKTMKRYSAPKYYKNKNDATYYDDKLPDKEKRNYIGTYEETLDIVKNFGSREEKLKKIKK